MGDDAALAAREPVLAGKRNEAARACALAAAASDQAAGVLREHLIDGEPCPVCGATEHRLGAIDAVLGEHLTRQRARLAELESEVAGIALARNRITGDLRVAAAYEENLSTQTADLTGQLATGMADCAPLSAELATRVEPLGLPPDSAELPPLLEERPSAADAAMSAFAAAQSHGDTARADELAARSLVEIASKDHAASRDTLGHLDRALHDLAHCRKALGETVEQAAARLDAALSSLMPWRTLSDPADWLRTELAPSRHHAQRRSPLAERWPACRPSLVRRRGPWRRTPPMQTPAPELSRPRRLATSSC